MEEYSKALHKGDVTERIITRLSILALIGSSLAVVNHFVGYSFLKGTIEGLGLGRFDVTLSPQESSFQTVLALRAFNEAWLNNIVEFISLGWSSLLFIAIVLGFYGYLIFDTPKKREKTSNKVSSRLNALPEWLKKVIAYPAISFMCFSVFMVLIFVFLSIIWGVFSAAYSIGLDNGEQYISKPRCMSLESSDKTEGLEAGCSVVKDAYGNILVGKVIFMSKDLSVIVSNTESMILNTKKEHLVCSPIYDLSKKNTPQTDHNCNY